MTRGDLDSEFSGIWLEIMVVMVIHLRMPCYMEYSTNMIWKRKWQVVDLFLYCCGECGYFLVHVFCIDEIFFRLVCFPFWEWPEILARTTYNYEYGY